MAPHSYREKMVKHPKKPKGPQKTQLVNKQNEDDMDTEDTAETLLSEKVIDPISVSPETTLFDALKIMTKCKIGAILIKGQGNVLGIWTERDLMRNALLDNFDPKTAIIGDYMTKELVSSPHDSNVYVLLDLFLGRRMRHILIEKDGVFLGLLSTGDVIKACMRDKDKKMKNLNKLASWNYYEDWKWSPK